jgi:hypothetical protein
LADEARRIAVKHCQAAKRASADIEGHSETAKFGESGRLSVRKPMVDKKGGLQAEAPLPAVSANTLARCLGVSLKVAYDLTKVGLIEHGPGRLYSLEDSVRRYCEHIRRQRATTDDP